MKYRNFYHQDLHLLMKQKLAKGVADYYKRRKWGRDREILQLYVFMSACFFRSPQKEGMNACDHIIKHCTINAQAQRIPC